MYRDIEALEELDTLFSDDIILKNIEEIRNFGDYANLNVNEIY